MVVWMLSWLERRANNANVMGSTPILAKAHVLKEALQRLGSPKHERMHVS